MFVDEAHFIKRRCIENGPIAMLAMDANIIYASTPATGESGIQNVLTGEVNGEEICTKVDFDFNCPACRRRQRTNPSIMCVHRLHLRPHIQNLQSILIARAAYGEDSDAFKREMLGSNVYGMHAFIDEESIQQLRDMPLHHAPAAPRYVFVSCDPSGSTKKYLDDHTSAYAMITAYMQDGKLVVILFIYVCILF